MILSTISWAFSTFKTTKLQYSTKAFLSLLSSITNYRLMSG